jgi:methylenetetrahydrofolate dehydrogenase (NADP+)/methenyltetrahydrofolate cyclohydrolase
LSSERAAIIDGKAIAAAVRGQVAADVARLVYEAGRRPGLATILVGDDPASQLYVSSKHTACAEVEMESFHHHLSRTVTREEVLELIDRLNQDDSVSGILCQLPVPSHLDSEELTNRIEAAKDVDGLTIANTGRLALGMPGLRPCTPAGVMLLLEHAGVDLRGKRALVIGRSNLFGKPMSQLLLAADATVTVCHSRTAGLSEVCREADVLVAAVGRPEMVRGSWVKPGAVVVDVGINRGAASVVGDVAFDEAVRVASAITPVPGGVGPMTIACLLSNTVEAARLRLRRQGRPCSVGEAIPL